ncbi:MAG TPA: hypothetical protein VND62_10530 [Acidimicrobiales bacterium]|nr:hypothetical protein [Acidimicrobiales bacterium]
MAGAGQPEAADPAGARVADHALTHADAAVRHGAYCWVERRLFELTGTWAAAPDLPDAARVLCFEASAQHAWHAELWEARLPVLAGVDPEQLTRPVGRTASTLLARLAPGAWEGDDETAGRRFLVGLARVVLPLLLVSYREYGDGLAPVADGPAIRALTLVVRDEEEELAAAQALADEVVGDPADAQLAAEWTRALGDPVLHQGREGTLFTWSEANFAG